MCVRLNRTETEKEAERIGNISYKFDSTRIEHCVKSDVSNGGVHTVEKNKCRKMISPFFCSGSEDLPFSKGGFSA